MSQADARFDAEPPPRGWFGRNWLWFVPTVIILPILLCGGCIGGSLLLYLNTVKSSQPYQQALARIRENAELKEKLGEPIEEATAFPNAQWSLDNNRESAKIQFSVKGPKSDGNVEVEAVAVDGSWSFEKLEVALQDGTSVDLSDEHVPGEDDAPAFAPSGEEPAENQESTEEPADAPPPALDIKVQ